MNENAVILAPSCNSFSFNTGIPYIGKIDFSNPLEAAYWGGIAASAVFAPGWWKLIVPVGILAIRYQVSKLSQ